MKLANVIRLLVYSIFVLATLATTVGIFSRGGPGEYAYTSVRGEPVTIYGKGIYQHMSADVAIQGIAQDVVTLCIALPLLLLSLHFARKGSLQGKILLTGTLFYFFLTYLFYLTMAMFNFLFLAYVLLLSASFFALILSLLSLHAENPKPRFHADVPVKRLGGFLIFSSIAIASMWLQVVLPPLWNQVYPTDLDHYTTLIVQGLDLALFLPLSFLSGYSFIKKTLVGYVLAPVYLVFLSLLMTALTGKIIAMALAGVNVIPVIIIIPLMNAIAVSSTVVMFKHIKGK